MFLKCLLSARFHFAVAKLVIPNPKNTKIELHWAGPCGQGVGGGSRGGSDHMMAREWKKLKQPFTF